MVTWYLISKLSKNKKTSDFVNHYNNLLETSTVVRNKTKSLCRVCLQEGKITIFDDEHVDVLETLYTFGDIQISKGDDYPKRLCEVCYSFVKLAIQFRKTAKRTEELLTKSLKEEKETTENFIQSQDHDYDGGFDDDPLDWQAEFDNIREEKKEKVKFSQKVTCNVCKKIINRSYLKEHITLHDPNHQKYVCEVCGKSFRLRCAYYNHSLRHRKDFPFKCQFCSYRGRYSELLKNHMRTHTGDYRYMCTECPARFLFKSNLNSHMLKHKEPQFKCDACKRAFHTKLKLQRHFEADHLGIRNHICSICGKTFGYRNAMLKHQRHVHKREKSMFGRMPSYLEAENSQQPIL